ADDRQPVSKQRHAHGRGHPIHLRVIRGKKEIHRRAVHDLRRESARGAEVEDDLLPRPRLVEVRDLRHRIAETRRRGDGDLGRVKRAGGEKGDEESSSHGRYSCTASHLLSSLSKCLKRPSIPRPSRKNSTWRWWRFIFSPRGSTATTDSIFETTPSRRCAAASGSACTRKG